MRFSSISIALKSAAKIHGILTHEKFWGGWGEKWDKNAYLGTKVPFLGVNENFLLLI